GRGGCGDGQRHELRVREQERGQWQDGDGERYQHQRCRRGKLNALLYAGAGTYPLSSTTATTTANIPARSLTVTATGVNKVYDGATTATVTLSDNKVPGDVFTDSYTTASFADKNVGNGKTVSVTGISISGTDAANYTFNTTASTTANITTRALTISATADAKVYDGNITAAAHLADDRIGGDVFTDSYTTATFADKNVGLGKTVSVS